MSVKYGWGGGGVAGRKQEEGERSRERRRAQRSEGVVRWTHRMERTQERRGGGEGRRKGRERSSSSRREGERGAFCRGGRGGFVGHRSLGCQEAPVWWCGGRREGRVKRRRRRLGAKTGPETNPSHRHTPSDPTDCSRPSIRQLTRHPPAYSRLPL